MRIHLPAVPSLTCQSRDVRTEKRENRREAKAETAAQLERAIESELLKRLQAGTYGDIYNFPTKQYEAVLDKAEARPWDPAAVALYRVFQLGSPQAVQGRAGQSGGALPIPWIRIGTLQPRRDPVIIPPTTKPMCK